MSAGWSPGAFDGERVAGLLDGLEESAAWLGLAYVAEEKDVVVANAPDSLSWSLLLR